MSGFGVSAVQMTGDSTKDVKALHEAVQRDVQALSADIATANHGVSGLQASGSTLPMTDLGDRSGVPDFSGKPNGTLYTWRDVSDGNTDKVAIIKNGKAYGLTLTAL